MTLKCGKGKYEQETSEVYKTGWIIYFGNNIEEHQNRNIYLKRIGLITTGLNFLIIYEFNHTGDMLWSIFNMLSTFLFNCLH